MCLLPPPPPPLDTNVAAAVMEEATPPPPCFIKVILSGSLHKLVIPRAFIPHMAGGVGKEVKLMSSMGKAWRVGVNGDGESMYFDRGWNEVAIAHELEVGYFLMFTYTGDLSFFFIVFDYGGCEKEYNPYNTVLEEGTSEREILVPIGTTEAVAEGVNDDVCEGINEMGKRAVLEGVNDNISEGINERGTEVVLEGVNDNECEGINEKGTELVSERVNDDVCQGIDEKEMNLPTTIHETQIEKPWVTEEKGHTNVGDETQKISEQLHDTAENLVQQVVGGAQMEPSYSFAMKLASLEANDVSSQQVSLKCNIIVEFSIQDTTINKVISTSIELPHPDKETTDRARTSEEEPQKSHEHLQIAKKRKAKKLSIGRKLELRKSRKRFNAKSPQRFEALIYHSNLTWKQFNIPVEFKVSNGLNEDRDVTLVDPQGRYWPVSFRLQSQDGMCKYRPVFGIGWREFAMNNDLRLGDKCIFELVSKDTGVINVQIFRRLADQVI